VQLAAARPVDLTAEADVEEEVFRQAYIPRKLEGVVHFERDAQRLKEGDHEGIYFQAISGLGGDGRVAASGTPKVFADALARLTAADVSGTVVSRGQADVCGKGEEDAESGAGGSVSRGGGEEGREEEAGSEGTSVNGDSENGSGHRGWVERVPVDKDALRVARKERKRAAKEVQAKKRLEKIPKKVKKRAERRGKVKS
jgi:RIO kinase 1